MSAAEGAALFQDMFNTVLSVYSYGLGIGLGIRVLMMATRG
jgi:hypothetical protein